MKLTEREKVSIVHCLVMILGTALAISILVALGLLIQ